MNIFLIISLNICFGAQKNRLIETILLSNHNIHVCFDLEIRKLIFKCALLSIGLECVRCQLLYFSKCADCACWSAPLFGIGICIL